MDKIKLKITTPERVVLEEEVDQVTLTTQEGEITVLPDHIPLIVNLVPGIVEAKKNGEDISMAISGGFLELHDNQLTVLADTAERAEEIDLERAERARREAEERKQKHRRDTDEAQYAAVVAQIEKQLARIKVAKRYQRKSARRMQHLE
jgi:F-type H+-transporting ATPase subunit epsilon